MKKQSLRLAIIYLSVILLAIFAITHSNIDTAHLLTTLKKSNKLYIILAGFCVITSNFAGALSYQSLSMHHLSFIKTVTVQFASSAVGKVVPSGAGNIGVMYWYLRKQAHTYGEATAVAALNAILGIISACIFSAIIAPNVFKRAGVDVDEKMYGWVLVALLILIILVFLLNKKSHKIKKFVADVLKSIAIIRRSPIRIAGSLLSNILISLLLATCLWSVVKSIGGTINIYEAMGCILLTSLAVGVTPTPGGIGGAEATLGIALTRLGLTPEEALSSALLYRSMSYLLPLLLGIPAAAATKKQLFGKIKTRPIKRAS